jgi:23S rRNA pseudouridine1911/1915/1917 synthase
MLNRSTEQCKGIMFDDARVVIAHKPHGVTSEAFANDLGLKLVHRIDKPTSGLLILARDARTVQRMQRLLRAGGVERVYRFIARGEVLNGVRESFLVRDRGDGKRGSGAGGKRAVAEFFDCVRRGDNTLGFARLVTGRTHQLRIQLAEEGHPIVGESVYANDVGRLMLHSERVKFVHPNSKQLVDVWNKPEASFV